MSFHESLERSNEKNLLYAELNVDRTNLKKNIFPYSQQEKNIMHQDKRQRKENRRWNYLHLQQRFPRTDLSCGELEENSFVTCTVETETQTLHKSTCNHVWILRVQNVGKL